MSRTRLAKKRAAQRFGCAAILAVMLAIVVVSVHEIEAAKPHVWVSGTLTEREIIGSGRSPALRLRLEDQPLDFRVDVALFREGMDREIPVGLVPGARVGVLVAREQIAHPVTPMLDRDVQIAWVRGLRVNGKQIFDLAIARSWEERNRQWAYLGLLISIGFVLYTGWKWRRARL